MVDKAKSFKRKYSQREVLETFLILCEGKNTERVYFKSFRLKQANIKTIHISEGDALSFVEKCIEYIKNINQEYDNYWLVFDKDDTTNDRFNKAIELACKTKLFIAYSIQAFEYWFLCHYIYHSGKMHRADLLKKMNNYLPFPYDKTYETAKKMYAQLLPNQKIAIRNAKNSLQEKVNILSIAQQESSTTVFKLVEALNKYVD